MFALFKWVELFTSWEDFAAGFGVTVLVSFIALIATLAISVVLGLARCSGNRIVKAFLLGFINFFQNTPLVVQLFFMYNVLPRFGLMLSPFACGCLGLSLYTGSFGASIVESAINAVPAGQKEAAYSQGMNYMTTMVYIILPQAVKIALPPLTNQAVNLIKNSSVLEMIAGGDLMYHADSWASDTQYYGPSFIVTGALYLALCLPLSKFAEHLQKKAAEK
jgi:putative glutamine transport system permease protein